MDLATLGIRVEGQEVVQADAQLDNFAAAAGKAETATERLASAARGNGAAMATMNTAVRQQSAVMGAARAATGLTSNEMLNLSRQTADIGVSIASGMPLWMVLIQQGSQVGDTFQMAAQRGVGFSAALRSIWISAAPVLAILAPIAIAAAAVGAVFSLAARDINRAAGDMSRDLNLTEEQMKRLKESGEEMGVSMGDVFRGLGTTIKEVLGEAFGPQIDQAKSAWSSFLDDLGHNTMNELRTIVGTFTGAYGAVKATWSMLPAALGDAAFTSARAIIGAMQFLIDRSVSAIQTLRDRYNSLPEWVRGGQRAPDIAGVRLGLPDNPYAGAMNRTGASAQAAYARDYAVGVGAVNDFGNRVTENSVASSLARQRGAGGDAEADRAAKAAREAREELEGFERISIRPLTLQLEHAITPLDEMAHRLGVINGLAHEMAYGLESAFGQSGRALGEMMTTMSGYQAQMAAWAAEEADMVRRNQVDFLRLQEIEAQRAMAQVQNYGDMASAAKGFFKEGSDGYRVMAAIEQAYRLQQMMGMMQSMIFGKQEAASSIAGSMAKGAASMAAGAAKMFESLGPWAFPVVAAMVGVLAGLGLRGGGGGGKGSSAPAANDNAPEATTAAVRGQTERQSAAQVGALSGMAQRVQVMVTADREGLNAYVVGTAEKVAAPMAVQAAASAVGVTRSDAATAQRRGRQRFV